MNYLLRELPSDESLGYFLSSLLGLKTKHERNRIRMACHLSEPPLRNGFHQPTLFACAFKARLAEASDAPPAL